MSSELCEFPAGLFTVTIIFISSVDFTAMKKLVLIINTANNVVQSLSHVQFFVTPWTAACQDPLSYTISQNLLRFMLTESVMSSHRLILCHHLLLPPSILPSIRVFSNESAFCLRWPKNWRFSFSISPSSWSLTGLTSLISLQPKGLLRTFFHVAIWKHQFFGVQPSLWPNSQICTWLLEKP